MRPSSAVPEGATLIQPRPLDANRVDMLTKHDSAIALVRVSKPTDMLLLICLKIHPLRGRLALPVTLSDLGDMNWQRGLFRLWLVLSVTWLIVGGGLSLVIWKTDASAREFG